MTSGKAAHTPFSDLEFPHFFDLNWASVFTQRGHVYISFEYPGSELLTFRLKGVPRVGGADFLANRVKQWLETSIAIGKDLFFNHRAGMIGLVDTKGFFRVSADGKQGVVWRFSDGASLNENIRTWLKENGKARAGAPIKILDPTS